MYLALNTFVYEVAKTPIEQTLGSALKFGFRFIEYAAYQSGDPVLMSKGQRNDIAKLFKDSELESSQMLLVNTQNLADPDPAKRRETLDYMKRCADFQLELGGKQLLICRGGG